MTAARVAAVPIRGLKGLRSTKKKDENPTVFVTQITFISECFT